jgi:protein-tyrosine phosphatase
MLEAGQGAAIGYDLNVKGLSMLDWHCHILPGVDDGPLDVDESVAMAVALSKAGYTSVCCTPHLLRGHYEADNETVRGAVAGLQGELDRRGVELHLLAGREYHQDEYLDDYLRSPLPLGDTTYLLMEIPGHSLPELVREACRRIIRLGCIPMVAHPERCRLFDLAPAHGEGFRDWVGGHLARFAGKPAAMGDGRLCRNDQARSLLAALQEMGCAFQGNLGSFAGHYGEGVRQRAEMLRGIGIYTHFGTDAHSAEQIRELGLQAPGLQPWTNDE